MEKTGLFCVRFMDDWIVLSPNRWKLKKAIQIVNKILNELKVEKHPNKTFIDGLIKVSTFEVVFLNLDWRVLFCYELRYKALAVIVIRSFKYR